MAALLVVLAAAGEGVEDANKGTLLRALAKYCGDCDGERRIRDTQGELLLPRKKGCNGELCAPPA